MNLHLREQYTDVLRVLLTLTDEQGNAVFERRRAQRIAMVLVTNPDLLKIPEDIEILETLLSKV